jgi:hypothetical protein
MIILTTIIREINIVSGGSFMSKILSIYPWSSNGQKEKIFVGELVYRNGS